jgi:hypothetical protein
MFAILRLCLLLAALSTTALAHPIQPIPIRSVFRLDGTATIRAEIDPRLFDAQPEKAEYFLNKDLPTDTAAEALKEKATAFVASHISFHLQPAGEIHPSFTWSLTGGDSAALVGPEDKVVLTGIWETTLPPGSTSYCIKNKPEGKHTVMFINQVGEIRETRVAALFPGEDSYLLRITAPTTAAEASSSWWQVFVNFLHQGFVHVVPKGRDHILFVLGLFLLSRAWKPLLLQVTTFTLAHSITLAMATLGVVEAPSDIVEPIIAASIAAVAFENIFRSGYSHWRLLVVFVFGLVHGLGFAGALSDLNLPDSSLGIGLIGFNIGVEGGQLAVIAGAYLATLTVWKLWPQKYRAIVVIPGSLAIAAKSIYWTLERLDLI